MIDGVNFDIDLLITQKEINDEARPCKASQELADRCIEEAQLLDIKPAIGDALYMRLFDTTDENAQKLWRGGVFKMPCGVFVFAGLRKALMYYAYGRIVRNNGAVVTRFDVVTKNDDYSTSAENDKRVKLANEAFAIADQHKADAVRFINQSGLFNTRASVKNNRLKLKVIGK